MESVGPVYLLWLQLANNQFAQNRKNFGHLPGSRFTRTMYNVCTYGIQSSKFVFMFVFAQVILDRVDTGHPKFRRCYVVLVVSVPYLSTCHPCS